MPGLSPNQLNSASNVDNQQNEILSEKQSLTRLQNEIGSKVLSLVNFESKHKDIVESSFNKARQNKEKLPGKNNERRNFAYLSRLDRMVEKYGNKAEQKLWAASAENLVMDYEDIPDAYWKQQEQILRDNGQGRELSEYEKKILAEDLIDKQRESITSWTNYLGDKNCPYPTWFKVYAFDGISKMSNTLNLDDTDYNRRDNTTALSFPKLNAEILAKVYRQINDFYGVDKENWLSKNSDDEKLVSLVKSANFPKLYAKELVDTKVILKTPERTEDVHGDWFEYKLGDEEEIASLAEGTRWCVVDPNVAHNYLTYGQYSNPEEDDDYDQDYEDDDDWEDGEEYDEEDDDYDDDDQAETYEDDGIKVENPEAKFIIFRLEDPNSPGVYASNGSASIRLDPDGKVAEVSGLNEGQAIEDSLIPIVKEKVLSMSGGKEFLQKFEDKQTLIRLDKKMEKGQDLTKEELSFLYELDRPIATLDTYNRKDPRIPELKEKYDLEYALEKGVDANKLASSLESEDIISKLDVLLRYSADIDNIVKNMDSKDINTNLDAFLKYHADIDLVVGRMEPRDIVYKLDFLFDHGANIDVNELVSKLGSYDILQNLDTLLKNGADIDVDQMRYRFSYYAHFNLDDLLRRGADINNVVNYMNSNYIAADLEYLYKNGADINNIVKNMDPNDIVWKLEDLNKNGANIDVNELVSKLDSTYVFRRMDFLLSHGADIDIIVKNMDPKNIARNLDYLNKNGANIDINQLVSNLRQEDITKNKNLNILLQHGADVNLITEKLSKKDIEDNIDLLRRYGANLDTYQENN